MEFILVALAGLVAGFVNVVAAGGSLIALPVLITVAGLPSGLANGTNRVAIFIQNIFAVQGFRGQGVSLGKFSLGVGISALAGAALGAWLATEVSDEAFNLVLASVLVTVGVFLWMNPTKDMKGKGAEPRFAANDWRNILAFFAIGIYGGFIQAGVGFLLIMAGVLLNQVSLVYANFLKVAVVLLYTALAIAIFQFNGLIDWRYGLVLAAGNATGGWLGSKFSVQGGDEKIRWVMLFMFGVMAIRLIWTSVA